MEGDCKVHSAVHAGNISIHSLRMEGDLPKICCAFRQNHFNPLPPYGGRPNTCHNVIDDGSISIHSLRMEGDRKKCIIPFF